jgi:hypothetical protein
VLPTFDFSRFSDWRKTKKFRNLGAIAPKVYRQKSSQSIFLPRKRSDARLTQAVAAKETGAENTNKPQLTLQRTSFMLFNSVGHCFFNTSRNLAQMQTLNIL